MELQNLHTLVLSCLKQMGWRLKLQVHRRLALDLAALCTGLRAVVMMDYMGTTHQLPERLCTLLDLLGEGVKEVLLLRIMSIDDMGYVINYENLHSYMNKTMRRTIRLRFVVLDDASVRYALPTEADEALSQFMLFKDHFLCSLMGRDTVASNDSVSDNGSFVDFSGVNLVSSHESHDLQAPKVHLSPMDLGDFLSTSEIVLPTLNGWLLGYPVIYLFKKENISRAVRTLSVSSLHRYELLVQSELLSPTLNKTKEPVFHELSSFTLPSELSSQGVNEEWAQSFLSEVKSKVHHSQLWKCLELRVTLQVCQSVAL